MKKRLTFSILGVIALAVALAPHWNAEASKPVAVIVDKQALVAQTGSFSPITLATPAVDGDYRISVYVESASLGSQVLAIAWNWTDDVAAQSNSISVNGPASNFHKEFTDIIHATAGNAITIAPGSGFSDTSAFNLYVTLEEL